jgi:hypothetical protein
LKIKFRTATVVHKRNHSKRKKAQTDFLKVMGGESLDILLQAKEEKKKFYCRILYSFGTIARTHFMN